MVSITSGVSLWHGPCYENMLNYDNHNKRPKHKTIIKVDFFIIEQILAFPLSTNLVGKVKNCSPDFKRIA